jgi:hypothetical protein
MGLLKKAELQSTKGAGVRDDRVETDIDRLYALVLEKAPLKLGAAAVLLGKRRELVEDWARTLEAASLIKIHYPAVGEPELEHPNGRR